MTFKNTELLGRIIKSSLLIATFYRYHNTEFVTLIALCVVYFSVDELILSKRLSAIEQHLNLKK
ncbi:hypothetical protein VHA01S_030_00040 [Vibrio halioticoli NBRC 102217]|uniref:Uncharacterized protein n=1 Tax=Vibrio halioticoli NBRC 102217 TaxID=1219072 RepID=V5F406_9VIBR|nr:hypothetical protein VHA01S_030_00040 [Vibrio halioticoli NBRC 102217]